MERYDSARLRGRGRKGREEAHAQNHEAAERQNYPAKSSHDDLHERLPILRDKSSDDDVEVAVAVLHSAFCADLTLLAPMKSA
jgi:hypothetical protein